MIVFICLLLVWAIVATVWALYGRSRLRKAKSLAEKARHDAEQLRSKLLEHTFSEQVAGLDPHLFKNTLNSIQSYAFKTHIALDKLGALLDFILYDSKKGLISLEEEIEFAQNLIELNKLRLNPLFNIEFRNEVADQEPFLRKARIVPLLTANFIENAFTHGDLNSSGGYIRVVFHYEDGWLTYSVANRKNPTPIQKKGGMGNETFKARLQAAYGDHFEIRTEDDGQHYFASLKIDLND